jgi:hypothetical protein
MSNGYSVRKLSGRFDPAAGWPPSTPARGLCRQTIRFVHGRGIRCIAKACGFYLPIYPLKGYSITLSPAPEARPLRHSVTDMERKLVFAPLARDGRTAIRVAGIADLESDTQIDAGRVEVLRRASAEILGIATTGDVEPWCGFRPMTPDSRPIIGWSPLDGLFINSGHGMLGWTLACGSARLTANMIDCSARSRPVRLPCAALPNSRELQARETERAGWVPHLPEHSMVRRPNSVIRDAAADQIAACAISSWLRHGRGSGPSRQ